MFKITFCLNSSSLYFLKTFFKVKKSTKTSSLEDGAGAAGAFFISGSFFITGSFFDSFGCMFWV